jgi:hypothetical protein
MFKVKTNDSKYYVFNKREKKGGGWEKNGTP